MRDTNGAALHLSHSISQKQSLIEKDDAIQISSHHAYL